MPTVTLDIPQDVLESAQLSTDELKIELALALYAQHRLSVGKAHELAGVVAMVVSPTHCRAGHSTPHR